MLAALFGWFTEGFDTRDLKEAKALLDLAPVFTLDNYQGQSLKAPRCVQAGRLVTCRTLENNTGKC